MASTIFKADPAAAVFEPPSSSSHPISHSPLSEEPHPLAWSFRLLDLLLSITRQAVASTLRRLSPVPTQRSTLPHTDTLTQSSLRKLEFSLTSSQRLVQHALNLLTALSDSSLQVRHWLHLTCLRLALIGCELVVLDVFALHRLCHCWAAHHLYRRCWTLWTGTCASPLSSTPGSRSSHAFHFHSFFHQLICEWPIRQCRDGGRRATCAATAGSSDLAIVHRPIIALASTAPASM